MYDKRKCRSCKYSAKVNEGESCCVYILIEDEMRGCYGDGVCPKYQRWNGRRRPKITKDGGFIYYDE